MSEGKIIVGIDVGTYKVVTVIAKITENIINVLGASEVKSLGIRKGQIVDIEEAVGAINTSLEAAERMAGYSASRVLVSLGGSQIECQNSRGVVAVSAPEGEITSSDLGRVIDAAKAVSIPSTREIIHVLPRSFVVDGQEGIKDPVGMSGTRLEVDTHIVTANSVSIRNLEKAFSEVGVDVDSFAFSGYASSLAVLSDTERELGVILVDIGAGTTDISIYVEGAVAYSSVLAIGARHVTNDLAIGLRLSIESAEKIKLYLSQDPARRPGIRMDESDDEKRDGRPSDEIDLSSLNLQEDIRKVSQKTLVDGIIKPRLNEICAMIGLEIKKSGFGGQTPAGIVLTGGGALTVGIKESARRTLAMPVRIGLPTNIKGIIDEVQHPAFSTAIGLIEYGAHNTTSKASNFKFNVQMPSGFAASKIMKRVVNLIKSFIP
ncbi:MAG TPA: cell division protein FtsA [Candidatus Limnocylindrales bacterium]|nr:cell division protein FtsA [Candidatus Limnocylindrales bacterium]